MNLKTKLFINLNKKCEYYRYIYFNILYTLRFYKIQNITYNQKNINSRVKYKKN